MESILDRYAYLTGLHWKGEITTNQIDEQHSLYHEIDSMLKENEQLKKERDNLLHTANTWINETMIRESKIEKLEEKLRKYEVLQYTPNELEIELNKFTIYKIVMEEIKEYSKQFKYGSNSMVYYQLELLFKKLEVCN